MGALLRWAVAVAAVVLIAECAGRAVAAWIG